MSGPPSARDPDSVGDFLTLGSFFLESNDLAAASEAFGAAVRLEPRSRKAWAGLGVILERLGNVADADLAWRMAFAGSGPAVSRYAGSGTPVRILVLTSAVDGNVPLKPILDDRCFQWATLLVESFGSAVRLPPHDVVLNAVGNADLRTRALECAERVLEATPAPVLNHPHRVRTTGRVAVAERLRGIPGVVTPRIASVARDALLGPDAASTVAAAGFTWPLLVRSPGYHTGEHFVLVPEPGALPAAVRALPGEELLLIAFIDTRRTDGTVRKYRVLTIGGAIYPLHLAVSTSWKVHYFSADRNTAYRDEELAFLDDPRHALGDAAFAALERVAATLHLDYGGIDFTLDASGAVVVFEANATMAIVLPGPSPEEAYRRASTERAIAAARALIAQRAARERD